MNEQKTVKVDPGVPDNSGGSTVYSGQANGELRRQLGADPIRGRQSSDTAPWRGACVAASAPDAPTRSDGASRARQPGGAQTMMIGPKAEPSFAWLVVVSSPSPNPYLGQAVPLKAGGTTTLGRVPGQRHHCAGSLVLIPARQSPPGSRRERETGSS